jgi:mannose-6-phosphate isomerase-like protein (cupin superfamily)
MAIQTVQILSRNLATPHDVRTFANGKVEIVNLGERSFARITLQPGWKWSTDVKPSAGTHSCMVEHLQYVISGRLMVATDDGVRVEIKAGDAVVIPPGHDAWVSGGEPFVAIDFSGLKEYARSGADSLIETELESDYY